MKPCSTPIYVLGTGLSHDGSACLLKDGRVYVAIEKERITRVKHDGGNDSLAIQYCLDAAQISIHDVALIVQNANFGMFECGSEWFQGKRIVRDDLPVVTISHHLAHAYSAFGTCPFDEAMVLVIDGCGNGLDEAMDLDGATVPFQPPQDTRHLYFEKDSYYFFEKRRRRALYKDFSPWGFRSKGYPLNPPTTRDSIGGLYAAVSVYVFGGMDDSGKLMGLAPYGSPGAHEFPVFELRDGRLFVQYEWMKRFHFPNRQPTDFKTHFKHYADLAYHVQKEVERAIMYVVKSRHESFPHRNLCYTGGVALNAVANTRILKDGPFRNVFIQPAAGDNGLALGAAYYGWLEVLKNNKLVHDRSTRFGRVYPVSAVEETLARYDKAVNASRSAHIPDETAEYLVAGKVVGWFQERSEFGPRALGGRSILADPRSSTVRDFINAKIKFREEFRPFAPSVPLEDAKRYFDCDFESPYMLLVAKVKPDWIDALPSIVHVDQTARIQTVVKSEDPLYYALLTALKQRTGIGVLLNTSFNRRGMPIVETPDQAVEFFLQCSLDVLSLGPYLVTKIPDTRDIERPASVLFSHVRSTLERKKAFALELQSTFQFNVSAFEPWTVDTRLDRPSVEQRVAVSPDITVDCSERELRALLQSPASLEPLIREGRLRISGSRVRVFSLLSLLNAP